MDTGAFYRLGASRLDSRPTSLFWRAVVAFIALPGLVAFVVPLALVSDDEWRRGFGWIGWPPFAAGVALLLASVREFYVAGKGTLAPWSPPVHLVVSGPYRHSRNPMYLAVMLVLIGWAAGLRSPGLWTYALFVAIAFHLRVCFHEEPWLASRHPGAWDDYRRHVRRWV